MLDKTDYQEKLSGYQQQEILLYVVVKIGEIN